MESARKMADNQHGISKGRSICYLFCEEVSSGSDKGKADNVLYLDFVKAFDIVPHKCLILKLKSMRRDACAWIESWLRA